MATLPRVYLTQQAEDDDPLPYEPHLRKHTIRHTPTSNLAAHITPWKEQLGFVPDNFVDKTLKATTQLVPTVEAETREHMRDHLVSRSSPGT